LAKAADPTASFPKSIHPASNFYRDWRKSDNVMRMRSVIGKPVVLPLTLALVAFFVTLPAWSAEIPGHRLILKDGSYQSITKYEVKGERVRYFSSERGEWEEVPKALIDWDATKKYEDGRSAAAAVPEAVELDKELEAERKVAEERMPQVAPGLHLPDDNGVFLLDTYQNEPQLDEIDQAGSDLNRNLKASILRGAVNPLAGSKETVEVPESHAKIQSHTAIPSLYAKLDSSAGAPASAQTTGEAPPLAPADRFKIIRLETKGNKRVAGSVRTGVTGKIKTDERFVPATVTTMTGGWTKITPIDPLPNGEYAIAEMLSKDGMNIYVWDFGVNPAAPANPFAWKPDVPVPPKSDAAKDLQKRQ
jgi:hypothetical protein